MSYTSSMKYSKHGGIASCISIDDRLYILSYALVASIIAAVGYVAIYRTL